MKNILRKKKKNQGLGRVVRFDERSRDYPVSELFTKSILTSDLRTKTWRRPLALDQTTTPQCVGYSLWGAYNTQPQTRRYTYDQRTQYSPTDIYNGAQLLDEWAGEEYDGSSVLGGVKWLHQMSLIKEYRWCFTLDDVLLTLSNVGPVVVGTNWLSDMFNAPDPDPGRTASAQYALSYWGDIVGGHAYELHGIDVVNEIVIGTNSWGTGWGDEGRMYLRWEDLEALLADQGEALVII